MILQFNKLALKVGNFWLKICDKQTQSLSPSFLKKPQKFALLSKKKRLCNNQMSNQWFGPYFNNASRIVFCIRLVAPKYEWVFFWKKTETCKCPAIHAYIQSCLITNRLITECSVYWKPNFRESRKALLFNASSRWTYKVWQKCTSRLDCHE